MTGLVASDHRCKADAYKVLSINVLVKRLAEGVGFWPPITARQSRRLLGAGHGNVDLQISGPFSAGNLCSESRGEQY